MGVRYVLTAAALLVIIACSEHARTSTTARPSRYGIGRTPTAAEIAAIDIDVNPAGVGLPAGSGTAAAGALIYALKCAICHGVKGEGIAQFPRLIGREPPPGFVFATDANAPRTIGNYWPYATTLYDYLHRAMPLNAPGSLTPTEIYSLVAYLLSENGVIPAGTVVDAHSLPTVHMPAQSHFVKDDREGGAIFR
ncbi:MAG: cytochrome c [bacterium]